MGTGWSRNRIVASFYRGVMRLIVPQTNDAVEVNGYLMYSRLGKGRTIDGLTQGIVIDKSYEPCMTRHLSMYLRQGMKVIDVGANVGYYTLLAAKYIGKSGKVWAFEPEPRNFKELLDNIQLNQYADIVKPRQEAVSNVAGEATLFVSLVESGEHSIVPCCGYNKKEVKVEMVRLDDVIKGECIDVLKTDTEGNDMNVLIGANKLLAHSEDILLYTEFWPDGLVASGHSPEDYWNLLVSLGFVISLLDDHNISVMETNLPSVLAHIRKHRNMSANLLCRRRK